MEQDEIKKKKKKGIDVNRRRVFKVAKEETFAYVGLKSLHHSYMKQKSISPKFSLFMFSLCSSTDLISHLRNKTVGEKDALCEIWLRKPV